MSVAWPTEVQLVFFFSQGFSKLFGAKGSPSSGSLLNLLSPRFLFINEAHFYVASTTLAL